MNEFFLLIAIVINDYQTVIDCYNGAIIHINNCLLGFEDWD
jgi:hypothetical protein